MTLICVRGVSEWVENSRKGGKGLVKYWRWCEITSYISHGSGRGSWAGGWGSPLQETGSYSSE